MSTREDAEAASARLVLRWYAGDEYLHRYRVAQVDDPAWEYLVPVCHEFPYPWRHPREMVDDRDLPEPAGPFGCCPACDVWARRHRHCVLVRGDVSA